MTVDELIKCLKELEKQGNGQKQVFAEQDDGRVIFVNSVYSNGFYGVVLSADEPVTKE